MGAAPPPLVWERYDRPDAWPTWAPHLSSVHASTPRITTGTTGTVTALGLVTADFTITDVDDESRRWSWTATVGPVRLHLEHTVDSAPSGAGTVAGLSVCGPLLVVDAYLPLARWALTRLVRP